jgi:hypothetical protein
MQSQQIVASEVRANHANHANYANPTVDILREQEGSAVTEKQLYMIMESARGVGDLSCPFCEKKFTQKKNRNAHFKICKQMALGIQIVQQHMETKNQVPVPVLHGTGDREGNSVLHENGQTQAATSQALVHKPSSAIQEKILIELFFEIGSDH